MQGIKWVKGREEGAGLRIIQQGQPKYIDTVRGSVCVRLGVGGAGAGHACEAGARHACDTSCQVARCAS